MAAETVRWLLLSVTRLECQGVNRFVLFDFVKLDIFMTALFQIQFNIVDHIKNHVFSF